VALHLATTKRERYDLGGAVWMVDYGAAHDVFVEPPSFDERIVNQYALFPLMSRADASLDDWLAERPQLSRWVARYHAPRR
jgi:hypothetical protein